jgi:TolB protein
MIRITVAPVKQRELMLLLPRPAILAVIVVAFAQPAAAAIVFTHAPDGGPFLPIEDIYTMADDGTNVRALTSDGHSHDPAWSPDGKRILFVHDAALQATPASASKKESDSHRPVELYVMDRDGGNRHLIRRMEPVIYSAAWSPDGKMLAVNAITDDAAKSAQSTGEPARSGLFLLNANGSGQPQLIFRNAFTPAWSPDGSKLAVSVEQPRGIWSLHVLNRDGSGDARLTDPAVTAGEPSWSPDGKLIAFDEIPGRDGKQQVFLMNADGSRSRQITSDPNWSCAHPSWSPDGNRLAFSCRSASVPCGGISDVGTPEPACTRRIFSIAPGSPAMRPTRLGSIDGVQAAFSPVP